MIERTGARTYVPRVSTKGPSSLNGTQSSKELSSCVMYMLYYSICYVMLCYVMLCYVMSYYIMLCYDMLCYVILS